MTNFHIDRMSIREYISPIFMAVLLPSAFAIIVGILIVNISMLPNTELMGRWMEIVGLIVSAMSLLSGIILSTRSITISFKGIKKRILFAYISLVISLLLLSFYLYGSMILILMRQFVLE